MGMDVTGAAIQSAAVTGTVNYNAAEVQAQQRQALSEIRLRPHNAPELADQFGHGINAHLPDGHVTKPDPKEYWKDPETKLTLHRLPHVSDEQFQKLVEVTRKHADAVVAYSLDQITGYKGAESDFSIELDTDKAIFQAARKNFSVAEKQIMDEKCDDLIASGVVQELRHSDYACNVVLAAKRAPDGTWSDKRFCINFIPINKHTQLDRYGSHRAEDLFQRVMNAKYLTALDLRSGFHQIPVRPEDISKTAFWYVSARAQPPKLLAYNRMPFGLKNTPAKFQRVMDTELQLAGCSEFAFAYIDDLLIASSSWEEHVVHVDHVLQMLIKCNLRIHPDKSVFGTSIVEYLGHNVVGEHGIAMNEAKVAAIKVLPEPTNVPELRSILGFLSYYRHFIPGFSSIAAPMTKLLHKDQPWHWGEEQAAAYTHLKKLMTEPGRVLRRVHPDRELILHTDWSNHGIGAVLGQKDEDGQEYMCGCVSRSLNKHEKNYPSYKGELLALAWAVRSFRTYIHGTHFKLITDHQPLMWLMNATDLTGQYARWQMLLQEYDFEIIHRPGIKHQNADVLSRFPQASTSDITGARLDVEHLIATMHPTDTECMADWFRCPHPGHGASCPGKTKLRVSHEPIPCPAHGPKCRNELCEHLMEAQYVWDPKARTWSDPKECRDVCCECCYEAMFEHPMRNEVCRHVCHKSCGCELPANTQGIIYPSGKTIHPNLHKPRELGRVRFRGVQILNPTGNEHPRTANQIDPSQPERMSDWFRCPEHGDDCPGHTHLIRPNRAIPCPLHGPTCADPMCVARMEAQYTWNASARRWEDPTECRDTCMECCSEALWDHPFPNEVCNVVCNKACGHVYHPIQYGMTYPSGKTIHPSLMARERHKGQLRQSHTGPFVAIAVPSRKTTAK